MHVWRTCVLAALALVFAWCATAARADDNICAQLDALYPQHARTGLGENAFRPLPLFVPLRSAPGLPGTLGVSIDVDHVSSAPKGKPGYVYVGNYPVTDIPVFKLISGFTGPATLVNPETGQTATVPNACLDNSSWTYGGSQWALVQGDTLDVLLQSRLDYSGPDAVPEPVNGAMPCRSSNLHTHGLLVSPYHPVRAGLGPYGDYVLDTTQPRGSVDFGTDEDNCGTKLGDTPHRGHGLTDLPLHYVTVIPGQPHVSSLASGEHPSGIFWYHPHPHGFSQFQLHGGTTGVVTIGDLTDYACPAGDGVPGNCTITNANIRVMALKDEPIQSYGNGLYTSIHDNESDLCAATGGERHGECQANDSTYPGGKWVFTVNGVEYPVLHAAAGRNEIWRIANTSPGVSYQLSIDPVGAAEGRGSLPFQLLAKDGVAIRQVGQAVMHTQMLMMPATRVEIYIPAPPNGGTYVLHNTSAETAADGYNSGDIWPSVDLAKIVWDKPAASAPASVAAPVVVAGPVTPIAHGSGPLAGVPERCVYRDGDTRVIYFVHRFVKVFGGAAGTGSAIHPSTNEVFGLIAGLRHADGSMIFYDDGAGAPLTSVEDVWKRGVHGSDPAFPALGHNNYGTVCTVKGNVEHWELQNWTGEDHNFHLHQSKFTIDPSGIFQFPKPLAGEDPSVSVTDALIRDFVNHSEVTFNDTVPVPRGQTDCATAPTTPGCRGKTVTQCSGEPGAVDCVRPGVMSVLIDFSRAEQVGTFVYHCHILEHEDGGMMAEINVLCPPGDASCAAQQAQAAICRPTAETATLPPAR